ncbi:type II secretion system F family protein [Tessaracoccus terricola]
MVLGGAFLVAAAWLAFPASAAGLLRLRPERSEPAVARLLEGRPGAPPLRQRAWLGAAVGVLVLVWQPGAAGALLAFALGVGVVAGLGWLWRAPATDPALSRQQAGTLELLAACLEAGAPMRRAVDTVAAVSEEPTAGLLERVSGQLRLGRTEADAWAVLARDEVWGAVARDVARSSRSGTALADGLLVHAEDQRRRLEAEQTRTARSVGVRSVLPLMVCFLPAFVLVGVVPIIAGLLGNFLE